MGHSSIRLKVRRRKVAILAARSKQFDVKNHMKKLAQSKDWKMVPFDTWLDKMPRFDTKVGGKYYTIDKDGHVHFKDDSWEYERHKQPKPLYRYKKRKHTGTKWTTNSVDCPMRVYDIKRKRHKRNDFMTFFPNYPYNPPKMNKVEYMEKLVQHKLTKWEHKNPKPAEEDDLFKEEYVTPWLVARNKAEERIRDFVVSVYDKLLLTGRFKINKSGQAAYQEEKIAEIKDINGEGHHVNELNKDSKLLKKAQEVTNKVHARRSNLVAANLRDHKKQKGRIILPKAA